MKPGRVSSAERMPPPMVSFPSMTSTEQPAQWRFMLQEVSETQRQHPFSSLEKLVTFLRSEILGEKGKPEGDQGSAF